MLTLSDTLHNYNYLNLAEGMRARVNSQFYGRKTSYETIFDLPEILGQFLGKDDHMMYPYRPSNNKSFPILNHFYFSFEGLVEGFVINYVSVI